MTLQKSFFSGAKHIINIVRAITTETPDYIFFKIAFIISDWWKKQD
jgi:hypothetical protein